MTDGSGTANGRRRGMTNQRTGATSAPRSSGSSSGSGTWWRGRRPAPRTRSSAPCRRPPEEIMHGLVRHLEHVERSWIRDDFAGQEDVTYEWPNRIQTGICMSRRASRCRSSSTPTPRSARVATSSSTTPPRSTRSRPAAASRCAGFCCTSSRRRPATSATWTCCASMRTARSARNRGLRAWPTQYTTPPGRKAGGRQSGRRGPAGAPGVVLTARLRGLGIRRCRARRVAGAHLAGEPRRVPLPDPACPEAGAAGHAQLVELHQFVGPRFLVTVHGRLGAGVAVDSALRETEAARQRATGGGEPSTTAVRRGCGSIPGVDSAILMLGARSSVDRADGFYPSGRGFESFRARV